MRRCPNSAFEECYVVNIASLEEGKKQSGEAGWHDCSSAHGISLECLQDRSCPRRRTFTPVSGIFGLPGVQKFADETWGTQAGHRSQRAGCAGFRCTSSSCLFNCIAAEDAPCMLQAALNQKNFRAL